MAMTKMATNRLRAAKARVLKKKSSRSLTTRQLKSPGQTFIMLPIKTGSSCPPPSRKRLLELGARLVRRTSSPTPTSENSPST